MIELYCDGGQVSIESHMTEFGGEMFSGISASGLMLASPLFCLLLGATAVQASTLTINDFSFEGPTPKNGTYGYQPGLVGPPSMTFPGAYNG